jgi:2-polyprenyl-6-methoxyphenol hydroxylase-like FAD-dependent oxidoreductase
MRHPLTGGGMTVALSDTRLLCEMLQPLPSFEDAIATARSTAEFYTKRKPVSATINTLANALYKVRMLLLLMLVFRVGCLAAAGIVACRCFTACAAPDRPAE